MSLFGFFKRRDTASAPAARERLRILLEHERTHLGGAEYLPQLQRELLAVVRKYAQIDDDAVNVQLDRGDKVSTLAVEIILPQQDDTSPRRPPRSP